MRGSTEPYAADTPSINPPAPVRATMPLEFSCRTKDNAGLVPEGTLFWEVVDLQTMVRATGVTSGDICNHAWPQCVKHVALLTLKEFMDDLNVISDQVYTEARPSASPEACRCIPWK